MTDDGRKRHKVTARLTDAQNASLDEAVMLATVPGSPGPSRTAMVETIFAFGLESWMKAVRPSGGKRRRS